METIEFIIDENESGDRIDSLLAKKDGNNSRSFFQKLIENGNLYINEKLCETKKYKVSKGDKVRIDIPEPEIVRIEAENIPLDIIYEDEDVLVINKPKGMVVHPAVGNYPGTMVNAIMYHCGDRLSSINGEIRPGIVHRIDKDTSGLIMVAKNDMAHNSLAIQLKEHSINRKYMAVVYNNFNNEDGTIDAPIGRDPKNRLRQAVVYDGGKGAVTHYNVMERFGKFTLVECKLETGRTHQIRVHMAYIKHPLLGDDVYGPEKNKYGVKGQMLHAYLLGFVHPRTGQYMEFEVKPPYEYCKVLDRLRLEHEQKII